MGLDPTSFRKAMGWLAAGVTVVTTRDREGQPRGLTATAVCSVSLEPPLLLVCIDHEADCYQAFLEADAFAVHLLREDQQALSRHFAEKQAQKFAGISHRPGITGVPILFEAMAHVECRVHGRHPGGDHTIFVGEAVDSQVRGSDEAASPLLHFRGRYGRLGEQGPSTDS